MRHLSCYSGIKPQYNQPIISHACLMLLHLYVILETYNTIFVSGYFHFVLVLICVPNMTLVVDGP